MQKIYFAKMEEANLMRTINIIIIKFFWILQKPNKLRFCDENSEQFLLSNELSWANLNA